MRICGSEYESLFSRSHAEGADRGDGSAIYRSPRSTALAEGAYVAPAWTLRRTRAASRNPAHEIVGVLTSCFAIATKSSPVATDADARLLEWELVSTPADGATALDRIPAGDAPIASTPDGGVARYPWDTAVRIRAVAG
jgi:hypothetical protein